MDRTQGESPASEDNNSSHSKSPMTVSRKPRPAPRASLGWRCSSCGELITRTEDGRVEWLAGETKGGISRVKGMRLVHRRMASPRGTNGNGCQYDIRRAFRDHHSVVEGLSLERFVGPDGLMLLLSFFAMGEIPMNEILELTKRVQIPGYEQARELFRKAVQKRVVAPAIADGFYLQSEIKALLRWASKNGAESEGPR